MHPRIPWIDRRFDFSDPVDLYPELIERLRGTPARVDEIVAQLIARGGDVLTQRDGGRGWSIQENIGHLADLEGLFMGRLDDFDGGADTLRNADMTNRKTHEANHNARPIGEITAEFRALRERLVARLDAMEPAAFDRGAMHPRLKRSMRVVDMVRFHAEHDDYHLARVRYLIRRCKSV